MANEYYKTWSDLVHDAENMECPLFTIDSYEQLLSILSDADERCSLVFTFKEKDSAHIAACLFDLHAIPKGSIVICPYPGMILFARTRRKIVPAIERASSTVLYAQGIDDICAVYSNTDIVIGDGMYSTNDFTFSPLSFPTLKLLAYEALLGNIGKAIMSIIGQEIGSAEWKEAYPEPPSDFREFSMLAEGLSGGKIHFHQPNMKIDVSSLKRIFGKWYINTQYDSKMILSALGDEEYSVLSDKGELAVTCARIHASLHNKHSSYFEIKPKTESDEEMCTRLNNLFMEEYYNEAFGTAVRALFSGVAESDIIELLA